MTAGPRKTHDFCWLNLMTPKADEAAAFFSAVLGWTYGPMPDAKGGRIILVDGLAAGAFMDLDAGIMPPGTPPVIAPMVRVDDIRATVARARELGGAASDPFTVHENGRMASVTDPSGAMLGLWEPLSKHGFDCDSRAHGAPTWFDVISKDEPRATAFYTALFGWSADSHAPAPGMTYQVFALDGESVGGAMQSCGPMEGLPSHWATTFFVTSVDAALDRAQAHEGRLLHGPHNLQGVGRFAMLQSPQGVVFHLVTWAR